MIGKPKRRIHTGPLFSQKLHGVLWRELEKGTTMMMVYGFAIVAIIAGNWAMKKLGEF